MEERPATIVSPHLDDAVLSCWHLLCGPGDVQVVNVFAGSPPGGQVAGWWDQLTGAEDSATRVAERRAEDREALAVAGRQALNLDFLDEQYQPESQTIESIVRRLRGLVSPETIVFAPAALGSLSADHQRIRTAALELAGSGQEIRLYADYPHAVRHGWPAWVNGASPELQVASVWDSRLREAGLDPPPQGDVHHLSDEEQTRKLRAISAYRTQLPALEAMFGNIDGFPVFPHEVVWKLG